MPTSTYDPPADWPWGGMPDELCSIPPDPDVPDPAEDAWPDRADELAYRACSARDDGADDARPLAGDGAATVDPAVAACGQIAAGLDALAALPAELVGHEQVLALVDALMVGRSRTAGLLARYVREVDVRSLYPPTWAGNPTATYLRHRYRLRPPQAKRIAERTEEVVRILPALGQAMVDGRADEAQADAIITGIDHLPSTSTTAQREDALTQLIDRCAGDDPLALKNAATTMAEELTLLSEDGEPPDDDEPDAHAKRSCTVRRVDGGVEARIFAPGEDGAEMLAYLNARSQPDDTGHADVEDPQGRDTRSKDQRQYDAFADAWQHSSTCEEQPAPPVPGLLVTLDYDALTGILSGGTLLDTGQSLPASVARRMCCEGALIPTVLDGQSLPLDLGEDRRLFSKAQRKALALRDRGCSFPGCDQPPAGCHAHHLTGWADGGPTDLANGTLLCGRHHRQIHRHGWTGRIAANGRPEYLPPPWIDSQQKPRQHIRYQLDHILRS